MFSNLYHNLSLLITIEYKSNKKVFGSIVCFYSKTPVILYIIIRFNFVFVSFMKTSNLGNIIFTNYTAILYNIRNKQTNFPHKTTMRNYMNVRWELVLFFTIIHVPCPCIHMIHTHINDKSPYKCAAANKDVRSTFYGLDYIRTYLEQYKCIIT